ncbi:hypothetical protein BV22DRAFT_144531 [Leucogyrophana mollusca]|uniref:Uncharacterized protein n=1 Tax=Leucogyrophana mollusca TaxID=85980 RepID=A0ACB8BU24_9AGAM|nr:hypothetical protein BV22DRAFT_144531 [Leucogyrophana mollusca]
MTGCALSDTGNTGAGLAILQNSHRRAIHMERTSNLIISHQSYSLSLGGDLCSHGRLSATPLCLLGVPLHIASTQSARPCIVPPTLRHSDRRASATNCRFSGHSRECTLSLPQCIDVSLPTTSRGVTICPFLPPISWPNFLGDRHMYEWRGVHGSILGERHSHTWIARSIPPPAALFRMYLRRFLPWDNFLSSTSTVGS